MSICRKLDPVYCEQKKRNIVLIEDLFIAVCLLLIIRVVYVCLNISWTLCSSVTPVSRGIETDPRHGGGTTVWVIVEWIQNST